MSSKIEYTCKGKGGRYEILGLATGAGLTRGEDRLIYKDSSTGRLFLRTESDFSDRMERLQDVAAPVVERQPDLWVVSGGGVKPAPFMTYPKWAEGDYTITGYYAAPPELAELQATIAQLESKLNNAINLDFERRAEIDRLKGGQGEPQVMGRVYTDDGITKCELNSIGRALPDHTPLYASQPAPASTASDIAQQLESVLAMFTPLDLTCNRALIEARACLDKVKELNQ